VKPLSCRLRHHKWKTVIEHGEEFRVCEECGEHDRGPDAPQMLESEIRLVKNKSHGGGS
jgi:hypothetical protein